MTTADTVALLAAALWLGMVLAISFLEAPLKFRAPGITLALGLGIGRLVFRALNGCEMVLAATVLAARLSGTDVAVGGVLAAAAAVTLVVQLVAIRPGLDRRAGAIIDGADRTPSHGHVAYIVLEIAKVALLVAVIAELATHTIR